MHKLSESKMKPQSDDVAVAATKVGAVWATLFAGVSLEDVYQFAGILVQVTVLVYTVLQAWVLIRDKLLRKSSKNSSEE